MPTATPSTKPREGRPRRSAGSRAPHRRCGGPVGPNPVIGLVGWAAVIIVGGLLLARVRLAPWFWIVFNLGATGSLGFVIWFIGQSVFALGTLCPWCMATWAVTIPLFWAVTLFNARGGRFGARVAALLGPAYDRVPAITVGSHIVVAGVAQARLDLLSYL